MRLIKFILFLVMGLTIMGCQTWGNHQTGTSDKPHQTVSFQHAAAPETPTQQMGYGLALRDGRFTDEWRFSLILDEGHFKSDALLVENFYPDHQPFRLHFFLNHEPYPVIHQGEETSFIDLEVRGHST